jgi:general secretion pathway protein G
MSGEDALRSTMVHPRAFEWGSRRDGSGLTLLELLFAVAVVAVLTTLAIGQFTKYIDRSKSEAAKAEIAVMSVEMERYRNRNDNALPDSLAAIGRGAFLDPWQRPYHYTKLQGVKGKGSARKDHKLNPINSDFDLFSAGKNGVYKPQISQKDSLDDIIRARDGSFIGLAADM